MSRQLSGCSDDPLQQTIVCRAARLKDDYSGRHVRVRGHKKVYCHPMFGVLALTVEQLQRLLL